MPASRSASETEVEIVDTLHWVGGPDGHVSMIEQTLLPEQYVRIDVTTVDEMVDAIRRLAVRGAPAIGVAAAYGVFLGVRERAPAEPATFRQALDSVAHILRATRPTAVNLAWAVERMRIEDYLGS